MLRSDAYQEWITLLNVMIDPRSVHGTSKDRLIVRSALPSIMRLCPVLGEVIARVNSTRSIEDQIHQPRTSMEGSQAIMSLFEKITNTVAVIQHDEAAALRPVATNQQPQTQNEPVATT